MTTISPEAAMNAGGSSPYWFSAFPFPPHHFQVHRVRGREAISKPYAFEVTVTSKTLLGENIERIAVGHRATLVMRPRGTPRVVPGVVESVRSEGLRESAERSQTTFRLVPMASLLRHQVRSRIFQDVRLDQVVDTVLHAVGVPTRWKLRRRHPIRAYITQYEESDLAFIHRLLAEAGIFYSFSSPAADLQSFFSSIADAVGGPAADVASLVASAAGLSHPAEMMVFGDDAAAYPSIGVDGIVGVVADAENAVGSEVGSVAEVSTALDVARSAAPSLSYMSVEGLAAERSDKVMEFVPMRSVRSDVAEYREFDPERPNTLLASRAGDRGSSPDSAGVGAPIDARIGTSTKGRLVTALEDPLSVAASFGAELGEALFGLLAERRLETYEHDGRFLFPDASEVEGVAKRIRQRRAKKRVTAKGRSGCVSLAGGHRFRLEDHPLLDENREHVVVSVEHRGDVAPDKVLYENSFRSVPASVTYLQSPGSRKTVQAFLTATVVGPRGEDIYVDAAGRIKVHFHWDRRGAGPDDTCWIRTVQPWAGASFGHQFIPRVGMEVAVAFEGGDPDKPYVIGAVYNGTHPTPFLLPRDKTKSGIRTQSTPGGVGNNELMFEDAKGRERLYIQAERDLEELVKHDMTTNVLNDETRTVGRDQTITIAETRRLAVIKNVIEQVGENHSEQVGGSKTTQVKLTRRLAVGGNDFEDVHGTRTTVVDKSLNVQVGKHCGLAAGDDKTPATIDAFSWGSVTVGAERQITLTAKDGIRLVCGDTVVEINKKGLTIDGGTVSIRASKSLTMAGSGPSLVLDDQAQLTSKTIRMVSKKASIALDDEAHVDGEQIKLNCKGLDPNAIGENGRKVKTKQLMLRLLGADLTPHANKQYILTAGGASFEGSTDGDGNVEHDVPEKATHADVVLFLGERPDGSKQRYSLTIEDLPDVATVRGALVRMQNLGYYWSELTDEPTELVARVLKEFQADQKLKVTGELDADTIAKLRDLHGH